MGKGVAIPYIVALVIGLMILVIMVYLINKFIIKGGGGTSAEICRSRFIDWCIMCRNLGWKRDNLIIPSSLVNDCGEVIGKHLGFYIDNAENRFCDTIKTKLDCCKVGVKNEQCP